MTTVDAKRRHNKNEHRPFSYFQKQAGIFKTKGIVRKLIGSTAHLAVNIHIPANLWYFQHLFHRLLR